MGDEDSVIGATGALGRDVMAAAPAGGQETRALVRTASGAALPAGVEAVEQDVLQPPSLTAAVSGERRGNLRARHTKPETAQHFAPRRDAEDCRGANASFVNREMIFRVLTPMGPEKAQERVVRDSELDWTLVRPPRFVGGKLRGDVRVIGEGETGRVGRVVRADLASFLVDCAREGRYVREVVGVGS